jgi:aminopeptidase N
MPGSTYDYAADCYYEVVYVQGDNYLDAYRQLMGDDAFWAGIRSYYTDYSFKIGGTKELFDELDTAAGGAAQDHSDRFPSLFPGAGG